MRDLITEHWLTEHGVNWQYMEGVLWEDITVTGEVARQIRIGGLSQDRIIQYSVAMDEGADFPAVIIAGVQPPYSIATGLHRHGAAELAGQKRTDAYLLLGAADADVDMVRRFHNTLNGLPQSNEEVIEQAIYAYRRYGMTVKEAAGWGGLRYDALKGALVASDVRDSLVEHLDSGAIAKLNKTTLVLLHKIDRLGDRAAVAAIAAAGMLSGPERTELIDVVAKAQTDNEAHRVIVSCRELIDQRGRRSKNGRAPQVRVLAQLPRMLMQLNRHLNKWNEEQLLTLSRDLRDEYIDRCRATATVLKTTISRLR